MTPAEGEDRRAELAASLATVEERIATACADAGRDPAELTLVAITKFFPASDVRILADLGVTDVGENRHQEAQASQTRGGHGARQTADIGGAGGHGHAGSPSTAEASRRTGRTRRILGLSVGRRGNRAPGIRRGRNRGRSGRSADL